MKAWQTAKADTGFAHQMRDLPECLPGADALLIAVEACLPLPVSPYGLPVAAAEPATAVIPGGAVVGRVVALGRTVSGFAADDRVMATLGEGALGERVVADAAAAHRLPAGRAAEDAAVLLGLYAPALHALIDRAALTQGETLLVLGAGSALGVATALLGRAFGARLLTSDDRQVPAGVADLDIIIDALGGTEADSAIAALSWSGRYVVAAGGVMPSLATMTPARLQSRTLLGVDAIGFAQRDPVAHRANVRRLLELWDRGEIAPQAKRVCALDDAAAVQSALDAGDGALVVRCA